MRQSGILMHITSLPGPYGVGTMGENAYKFVDFLQSAGQSCWQILPLNPTGYGDSPYQSFSSWAGNPYLIDLDILAKEGLLRQEELEGICWETTPNRVDFGLQYTRRYPILRTAHERFVPGEEYDTFCRENTFWLNNYALFMAIKDALGGAPWLTWPEGLKTCRPEALEEQRQKLRKDLDFYRFLQYQFFRQWKALRRYANEKGIRIIGDIPIYVPLDSADVWANPHLFQLDSSLRPTSVAGCPPDSFTADGQLWGNPLYDWPIHEKTGYRWWIRRLFAAAAMYDVVRIDHFRGLESYWSVPAQDETAKNGHWCPGPGMSFVHAVREALPGLDFIAEDLGYITPEVRKLQQNSGYPGMKVLEFAFDSREESDYLPHLYPVDSVCYTGTHDNPPLGQWLEEAAPEDVACAKAYLGLNQEEGYIWGIIRGAMSSVSRLCVVQLQDYLELGMGARMNKPGSLSCANWTWRAVGSQLTPALAEKIRSVTKRYGRLPKE